MELGAQRDSVRSGGGMVATSQVHAAEVGASILRGGGNAADAAIATAAALAVTEPCSNGLGGDCFALHYDASTDVVTALNGSGRCPMALDFATAEAAARTAAPNAMVPGGLALPPSSPLSITVPGAVRGWFDLLDRHGTMAAADLLAPAIALARDGFEVGPITAHFWRAGAASKLAALPYTECLRGPSGGGPAAGETFVNREVAAVLEALAGGGADAFYLGPIATAIADTTAELGGVLSVADLAAHHSTWQQPLSVGHGDVRLWECPPNGQGIVALLALRIGDRLRARHPGAHQLHVDIEAMRLSFECAVWAVADPSMAAVDCDALLSDDQVSSLCDRFDPDRASTVRGRDPMPDAGTVYLAAVDSGGNACSLIQSNYMGFGTGIVPRGLGFTLQNRGHNFPLIPDHPGCLAPGKRPYHTIIPALTTHESGSLHACFGVMGGFMQPQGHVQVLRALVDDGDDPQTALDRPRWHVDPFASASRVRLETGFAADAAAALRDRAHSTRKVSGWNRALFGRGQIIVREASGELCGGSDRRADGAAVAASAIGSPK